MRYYSSTHANMPQLRNGDPWGTFASMIKYVNNLNKSYNIISIEKQYDNKFIRIYVDNIELKKGQTILLPNEAGNEQAVIYNKSFEFIDVLLVNDPNNIGYPEEFMYDDPGMVIYHIGLGMEMREQQGILSLKSNNSSYSLLINDTDPSNDIYTYEQTGLQMANPVVMIESQNGNMSFPSNDDINPDQIAGISGAYTLEETGDILYHGITKWEYQRSNITYSGDGRVPIQSLIKWHLYGDGNSIIIFFDNPNVTIRKDRIYGYMYMSTRTINGDYTAVLNACYQDNKSNFYDVYDNEISGRLSSNLFAHKQIYELEYQPDYIKHNFNMPSTCAISNGWLYSKPVYMAPLLYAPSYSGNVGGDFVSEDKIFSPFCLYDYNNDSLISPLLSVSFLHNKNINKVYKSFSFINLVDNNNVEHYYSYINIIHYEMTNSYAHTNIINYANTYNITICIDLLSRQFEVDSYQPGGGGGGNVGVE